MAERCTQAGLASSRTGPTPSRSPSDPCLFGAHRARIRLIGHQRIGRDFTEQAGLEVLQGLSEFGFGIHYKGSVRRDRLPDRLAPQDEQFQGGAAGILVIVGADLEPVAPAEHDELALAYRPALAADGTVTLVSVGDLGGFVG
jgi:hypothetical protein